MMMLNGIRRTLPIAILAIVIVGCGGTFKPPAEKEEAPSRQEETQARREFRYDPLGLKEDLAVVPEVYSPGAGAGMDTAQGGAAEEIDLRAEFPTSAYESYRIQLFTSKEYGPAYREFNIANEVFDKKVWFDYEVPYYKVRVGDFKNRGEAERYVGAAQEAGYTTAWVVKVNTNIKTLEDIYDTDTRIKIDSLEQQDLENNLQDTTENIDHETYDQEN